MENTYQKQTNKAKADWYSLQQKIKVEGEQKFKKNTNLDYLKDKNIKPQFL